MAELALEPRAVQLESSGSFHYTILPLCMQRSYYNTFGITLYIYFGFSEAEVSSGSPDTKSRSPVPYILPYLSICTQSVIVIEHP